MSEIFKARLDVLPSSQRHLWDDLAQIPSEFVLYGGTAIALHLGHRESVDFDFFSQQSFDPLSLQSTIAFLAEAIIYQSEPNTLSCMVIRNNDYVKCSFFGLPNIIRLKPYHIANGNGLKIASLLDLAGMKAAVVQKRIEAKDYIDIDAIITSGIIDLPMLLAAGRAIYGKKFNPYSTLKSLCWFNESQLSDLSEKLKKRLIKACQAVDLMNLPVISPQTEPFIDDHRP